MPTRRPASWAVVLITVAVLAACDAGPVVTGPPAVGNPTPAPSAGSPGPSEEPFSRASWPASGSACGTEGYTGNLGRIEATEARTVVFTLCAPDGAFLSRVAHPALGILDAATIAELATNPDSARSLAGTGPYRIDHWTPGQNVRLVRAGDAASADAKVPTLVLTWADDPTQRTIGLQSATVDGIDAPGPADLDRIATLPELAVFPRDGLATAYLGFGTGDGMGKVAVRRALAGALDRDTLASDGFAAGSIAATHVTPCEIDGGCGGTDWYGFNAPAASAALAAAKFDLGQTYMLHIPDRPVPGLPDPAGLAKAVAAQLETNIGLHTEIDTMPFRDYQADLATGKLDGLFLGGVASSLADPGAFLEPLFGADVHSTAADRTPKAAPRDRGRRPRRRTRRARRRVRPRQRRHPRRRRPRPAGPPGLGRRVPYRRDGRGHLAARPRPLGRVHARRPQPARVHAGERARRRVLRRPGHAATPTGCAASSWRACTASSRGR